MQRVAAGPTVISRYMTVLRGVGLGGESLLPIRRGEDKASFQQQMMCIVSRQ